VVAASGAGWMLVTIKPGAYQWGTTTTRGVRRGSEATRFEEEPDDGWTRLGLTPTHTVGRVFCGDHASVPDALVGTRQPNLAGRVPASGRPEGSRRVVGAGTDLAALLEWLPPRSCRTMMAGARTHAYVRTG
jgi:hypothetical protein